MANFWEGAWKDQRTHQNRFLSHRTPGRPKMELRNNKVLVKVAHHLVEDSAQLVVVLVGIKY